MSRAFIPNLLTFLNLTLGIMSIIVGVQGDFITSGLFILAAGLVDRYDGRIARILNAESPLGKELDSLSDMVSFGVAPAILTYFMFDLRSLGILGLLPIFLFPVAGAYRLARYNASTFNGVFMGLPITIAGCAHALLLLLMRNNQNLRVILIVNMLCLSYLMVSTLKIKKN